MRLTVNNILAFQLRRASSKLAILRGKTPDVEEITCPNTVHEAKLYLCTKSNVPVCCICEGQHTTSRQNLRVVSEALLTCIIVSGQQRYSTDRVIHKEDATFAHLDGDLQ